MLLALSEQPGPNVELEFIGGRVHFEFARWKYDAMTVGEGYDTRFYECPVREPIGVVNVDGVWHWALDETEQQETAMTDERAVKAGELYVAALFRIGELKLERDRLAKQVERLRNGIKLCIGVHNGIPWRDVRDADVDSYINAKVLQEQPND